MYTHREDAVAHAVEVRRQGQAICDEINKRPDRNCLSMTSSVEQSLTDMEKAYTQIRAGEFDK